MVCFLPYDPIKDDNFLKIVLILLPHCDQEPGGAFIKFSQSGQSSVLILTVYGARSHLLLSLSTTQPEKHLNTLVRCLLEFLFQSK